MNATEQYIEEVLFALSSLKTKAKSIPEYELADTALEVLRIKWEKYCENPLIYRKFQ